MSRLEQNRQRGMMRPIEAVVEGTDSVPLILVVIGGLVVGLSLISVLGDALAMAAVAATMLLLLAVLNVSNLKQFLLAVMILEIPLQIDIYLDNDDALADIGGVSGLNISVTTFCLFALYSLWLAELAAGRSHVSRRAMKLAIPAFTYLATVLLSVFAAADYLLSFYELVILIQALLLFLYVLHYVRSEQDAVFVVVMIVLGLLVQSLIVIGVRLLNQEVTAGPIMADFTFGRQQGTFGSPNVLGSYLALTLPIALCLMLAKTQRSYRWLGALTFGLGAVALVLSFSRGAWVGFGVSFAIVVLYAWRQRWLSDFAPWLLGLVGLALILLLQDEIFQRITADDNSAAISRLPLMDLALQVIGENPLRGVGANNFSLALAEQLTLENSRDFINTVHNKYLLVWAENGIGGLLAFLWFMASAVRYGWQRVVAPDKLLSPLALGLAAGLVANMIHMNVDIFNGRSQTQMIWLVAALLAALKVSVVRLRQSPDIPAITTQPSLG